MAINFPKTARSVTRIFFKVATLTSCFFAFATASFFSKTLMKTFCFSIFTPKSCAIANPVTLTITTNAIKTVKILFDIFYFHLLSFFDLKNQKHP
jgi:hypothetical protein